MYIYWNFGKFYRIIGINQFKVMDRNFEIGNMMLPLALDILQYIPSPQRYASDYQPPNYTLWFLEPHTRLSWLQIFLVVLYKHLTASNGNVLSTTFSKKNIDKHNTNQIEKHDCDKLNTPFIVATWNVRTLYQTGIFESIKQKMKRMNLSILGLSETLWKTSSVITFEEGKFFYSEAHK
ncbi:hypothetical protein HELRODRAFT_182096 [Helobdella robusta]|uniref:Endonuclease/exonuclease/phosphatase domain-containing protein n=1 Tax=Helobdella robusta TaxID=6412 RepID=T1FHQ7_HELRO|nr:hypothetical protein HELRODRAFT_182096 [Helobdella robusta]ESN91240.1 hypothetical protein HELRODRAFT_182096 [Helobdella robusta]